MQPSERRGSQINSTCLRDSMVTLGLMSLGCLISAFMLALDSKGNFVNMIFVLIVVLVARFTTGYLYGVATSFVGVICVNYIFTYPYWRLDFTIAGYPLTFLTMLSVSLIVSTLTSRVKQQEQMRMEAEREIMRANLLRAVSHDLRTPLTSIVGSTSALMENGDALSPTQKYALLRSIRDEAQWLIRMVENLLSITRMGDATNKLNKEPELAEEVLSSVAQKFLKRFPDIKLQLSAPEEPLLIPMDAILIEQVLMNLMENAVYHGDATAIDLSVVKDGDDAIFTITDNGHGLPEQAIPTIFRASQHGSTTSSDKRRNMGIGLSVCDSIVKVHGGTMSAENSIHGGATFRFTLPQGITTTEDTEYADQRKDSDH